MNTPRHHRPVEPPLIDGVFVKKLKVIPDERGRLMELLRSDDQCFRGFCYSYLTTAYPGVVKAWHMHHHQWDHMAVVHGMARIALFDDREGSRTRGIINEFHAGIHNPVLVGIPPRVYHGFKATGTEEALVINFPTQLFDPDHPDEYRLAPDDPSIPFDWSIRQG